MWLASPNYFAVTQTGKENRQAMLYSLPYGTALERDDLGQTNNSLKYVD